MRARASTLKRRLRRIPGDAAAMKNPGKERREFALLWEIIWPAIGATAGLVMGAVIGAMLAGAAVTVLLALVGAVLGMETGHLFGEVVRLLAMPWLQSIETGDFTPVFGGALTAGILTAWAIRWELNADLAILLGCLAFTCGGVLFMGCQLLAHRIESRSDERNGDFLSQS